MSKNKDVEEFLDKLHDLTSEYSPHCTKKYQVTDWIDNNYNKIKKWVFKDVERATDTIYVLYSMLYVIEDDLDEYYDEQDED